MYNIRATKPALSDQILAKLRRLQWDVDKVIAMAKTRWLRNLAEVIHKMSFQPKEDWTNIRLLSKGENSHHSYLHTIQTRLPPGDLETTDEENVRVFSAHYQKMPNDMKPTHDSVINEIHLHDALI